MKKQDIYICKTWKQNLKVPFKRAIFLSRNVARTQNTAHQRGHTSRPIHYYFLCRGPSYLVNGFEQKGGALSKGSPKGLLYQFRQLKKFFYACLSRALENVLRSRGEMRESVYKQCGYFSVNLIRICLMGLIIFFGILLSSDRKITRSRLKR